MYYRDAVGAIICYDLTDERSFGAVQYWIDQMLENTSFSKGGFTMALAGNKCDMPAENHKIPKAEVEKIVAQYNMIHSEVSAKTGEGLTEMFRKISEQIQKISLAEE